MINLCLPRLFKNKIKKYLYVIVVIDKKTTQKRYKKMTKCHFLKFYNKKDLTLNFNGGDITSDAGLLLFKEFDNKICLTKRMSACIKDERDPRYIDYSIQDV